MRGVYQIRCKANGKRYVGSSGQIEARWKKHIRKLKNGDHENWNLQASWSKYGEQQFEFTVLEIVGAEISFYAREQYYLDTLEPEFNIAPIASCPPPADGVRRRKESIERARQTRFARYGGWNSDTPMPPASEERKAKIAERQREKWSARSPEERKAIGRKIVVNRTPEQQQRLNELTMLRAAERRGMTLNEYLAWKGEQKRIKLSRQRELESKRQAEEARRAKIGTPEWWEQRNQKLSDATRSHWEQLTPEDREQKEARLRTLNGRAQHEATKRGMTLDEYLTYREQEREAWEAGREERAREGNRKRAESKRGKPRSPETIEKMRIAATGKLGPNKGRVFSPEVRERMSQAAKARRAREKQNNS